MKPNYRISLKDLPNFIRKSMKKSPNNQLKIVSKDKRENSRRESKVLPPDILIEILKDFPAKNLMRLRCVSKTFNSIIRDPVFARLHQKVSQTRPGGTSTILMDRNWPRAELSFYKINPQREAVHELTIDLTQFGFKLCQVTEMVNGLICLGRKRKSVICNITTHESVSLPCQAQECPLLPIYSLGYDPVNNEYKVLCIWFGSRICKCWVITVGKDKEWREVADPLHNHLVPRRYLVNVYGDILCDAVYHNGAIHWLSQSHPGKDQKLVSFDVREEKFSNIGVPIIAESIVKLVLLGDDLVVFGSGSNLLLLKDYKNEIWVEWDIFFPRSPKIWAIGSMGNKLIYRQDCERMYEFDPNNGMSYNFFISGLRELAVTKSMDSTLQKHIPYPSKISISEFVENIQPLRQN